MLNSNEIKIKIETSIVAVVCNQSVEHIYVFYH